MKVMVFNFDKMIFEEVDTETGKEILTLIDAMNEDCAKNDSCLNCGRKLANGECENCVAPF